MSKHHLCKKSSLLLLGCMTVFSACGGNSSSTKSQDSIKTEEAAPNAAGGTTLELYNLKAPVKEIKEWSISISDLANNPGLNPAKLSEVEAALRSEVLDKMETRIYVYRFTPDLKADDDDVSYSGDTPIKTTRAGLPGTFDIGYENGLPTKFTLNEKDFQKSVDEGMLYLDAFEIGLEEYTIAYDSNGIPKSLSGKKMPFFEGGKYTETYSDYKYDDKGNWVKRKVTTPYDTMYQFRSYTY